MIFCLPSGLFIIGFMVMDAIKLLSPDGKDVIIPMIQRFICGISGALIGLHFTIGV